MTRLKLNGYRRLVASTLALLSGGGLCGMGVFAFAVGADFRLEHWVFLSIALGLLSFALTVLLDRSPLPEIGRVLAALLTRPPEERP